ncbi:MAG: hypothetical protein AAGA55_04045 [Planctomycetota bacterium]
MKRAVASVASGCMVCGASAQSLSVHLSFDASDAAMGEIVTASLIAEFDGFGPNQYFSDVYIDLIASTSDVYEVIDVAPVMWNNPGLGFNGQGVASGSDVLDIRASQFHLIPPVDFSNPIVITTFSLKRVGTGSVIYSAQVAADLPYMFAPSITPFGDVFTYNDEVFTSDTLLGTPSPGVLGVFGAGCALASRRRR